MRGDRGGGGGRPARAGEAGRARPAGPARLGVVGCGDFARFAVPAAAPLPEVDLAAVADPDEGRRRALAAAWLRARAGLGLPAREPVGFPSAEALLAASDADVIWVLTPPHLHHPVARAALEAGRHVFLEKPGSLSLPEMDDLLDLASRCGLRAGVDFVMRHNPLYRFLEAAIGAGVFGPPERASLENDARGDHLPPGHWFWDEARSGGIWVEHGVHFFDLLAWLLGPPAAVAALGARRGVPGPDRGPGRRVPEPDRPAERPGPAGGGPFLEDAVAALTVHPRPAPGAAGPALATHYHGFTRAAPLERTTLSLVFQRGWVEVEGWIAVRLRGAALLDGPGASALERLARATPWLTISDAPAGSGGEESPGGGENLRRPEPAGLSGRGLPFRCERAVVLTADLGDRQAVYREAIRSGLRDLLRAARSPAADGDTGAGGAPGAAVDLRHAREALRVALAARQAQRSGVRVQL